MKPEEIGDLLGTDPDSVVAAREAALRQLATELDMEDASQLDEVRTRLAELPAEAWSGGERPRLSVVKQKEPARREAAGPPPERRRSRLPLLLALLAVAAVVLVIVLATSGGSDNNSSSKPQASAPKPAPQKPKPAAQKPANKPAKPKPAAPANSTKLTALGGSGGSGTAALTHGGGRLVIKATGMPSATYQVWLYNSIIDATSLTKVSGTTLSLDLKLPANASHYRYVDISREPADGNPNHSGESVLRAALSKLSR